MKAVFDTRPGSGYDDDITRRYHFPDRYLPMASQAVGDWVVYREPRRGGGREGYVAVARLVRIEPDRRLAKHSYAVMDSFLSFGHVVPLKLGESFHEGFLAKIINPSQIGPAMRGKSVRAITGAEFGTIVHAGLRDILAPENALRLGLDADNVDAGVEDLIQAPAPEQERRIVQVLTNRKLRDAAFRSSVLAAYDDRCAVTGLRIVNGGGRAEAQAAHIWPVAEGGPDVVQNGIALSATAHWLFDRHLISLTDEFGLLVSHNKVPSELRGLFERQMERICLPNDRALWPHLDYVRRHREAFADA